MQSPAEQQFNEQVANSPIVKEIIRDLSGLKVGQIQLGDDMKSLEKKVDNGFNTIATELKSLTDEIRNKKEQDLIKANEDLSAKLDSKQSNSDKIKNGSILSLVGTLIYFAAEKFGALIG